MTLTLLRHIEALGYFVSVHRTPPSLLGTVGAFTEIQAIDIRAGSLPQVARVGVDEGGDTD